MSRVLIIGANGGIGRQCVQQALDAGHFVTALLRNPAKLTQTHPHLQIVKGDITDLSSIKKHFQHQDMVISALGVSGGFGGDKPTTLYSQGAATILTLMQETEIRRAFFISASAIEISPVLPWYVRFAEKYIVQKLLKHMYADLRTMETIIKGTDLDWTIIRPPQLTNKPATGKYRFAANNFLENCLKISRGDVAHFIIKHMHDDGICKGVIEIGY